MNKLTWKIGETYQVRDLMSMDDGLLEGFICNDDNDLWMVFSMIKFGKNKFTAAKPEILNEFTHTQDKYSKIVLYGKFYSDSIEELVAKISKKYFFKTHD